MHMSSTDHFNQKVLSDDKTDLKDVAGMMARHNSFALEILERYLGIEREMTTNRKKTYPVITGNLKSRLKTSQMSLAQSYGALVESAKTAPRTISEAVQGDRNLAASSYLKSWMHNMAVIAGIAETMKQYRGYIIGQCIDDYPEQNDSKIQQKLEHGASRIAPLQFSTEGLENFQKGLQKIFFDIKDANLGVGDYIGKLDIASHEFGNLVQSTRRWPPLHKNDDGKWEYMENTSNPPDEYTRENTRTFMQLYCSGFYGAIMPNIWNKPNEPQSSPENSPIVS